MFNHEAAGEWLNRRTGRRAGIDIGLVLVFGL